MMLRDNWTLHLGWGLQLAISGPSGIGEGWEVPGSANEEVHWPERILKNYVSPKLFYFLLS